MKLRLITILSAMTLSIAAFAQATADDVLALTRKANDYFMNKYEDPTVPTNVKKIRPSSLWTRAVYYEGLMALNDIDPQARYIDYTDRWADFHKWTPRNGVKTTDADDQCCSQTYLMRYAQTRDERMLKPTLENLDLQMQTKIGWWTWIDAIQMAMPVYMQAYQLTGETKYRDHGMKMYRWSRNECGGGLFNTKGDLLWWRDADYVPPYKEPDGKDCYWSRGNGWVYAALVRCMNQLSPKKDKKVYRELLKDFRLMTKGIASCQREDGFWNPSLVSTNYAMPETSGTALFLYGLCWGMNNGYLKAADYRQPLSYDRIPDFEDYGTGCFLLGATEYYKLLSKIK